MKSKNWPRRSALACAISLLASGALSTRSSAQPAAQPPPRKPPAIALLDDADAADAVNWRNWTRELGWKVLTPTGPANANIDLRVLDLAKAVEAAVKSGEVDPARIYLAGRGDGAAAIFYAVSRVPDLWAAAVALGGSARAALDTNRIFAANFSIVPVLWVSEPAGQALAQKLQTAGINLEWQSAATVATASAVIQWLGRHNREDFPPAIDCETNSPTFARCYWIQMMKFDAAERNDVLPSTRISGGNGAALDLGGFSFKLDDPGPGVLVSHLPEKYSGPLRMGDRIVALDGREIVNGRQYRDQMEKVTEEKLAVATVQRGKDRIRIETRVIVPRSEAVVSARVQAQYTPADKEIQVISRTVTEMHLTVPQQWAPVRVLWNGISMENIQEPGCWLLTVQKELLNAARCP